MINSFIANFMNINLELSNKNQSEIMLHLCHHKAVLTKKKKSQKTHICLMKYIKNQDTLKKLHSWPQTINWLNANSCIFWMPTSKPQIKTTKKHPKTIHSNGGLLPSLWKHSRNKCHQNYIPKMAERHLSKYSA